MPDGTRTCPLPLLLQAAYEALADRASEVTVLIALGTHQGMSEEHLARHLGYPAGESELSTGLEDPQSRVMAAGDVHLVGRHRG